GVTLVNALSGVGDGVPVLGTAGGKLFTVATVPSTTRPGITGLFTHDPASPAGTPLTLLRRTGPYLPLQQRLLGDGTRFIADYNGEAYLATYSAASNNSALELIRSDGTERGTVALHTWPYPNVDAQDTAVFVAPWRVVAGANGVYFVGNDPPAGAEPWRSDGTPAGTARVADLNAVTLFGVIAAPAVELNGRGIFYARVPGLGLELWSTDGTAGGTQLLKDVYPGPSGSLWIVPEMELYNGRLYFRADDGAHGDELWSTDGTPAGTSLLKDINPTGGSNLKELTVFRGRLWFIAADPVHGDRLWSTDGTEQGTVML